MNHLPPFKKESGEKKCLENKILNMAGRTLSMCTHLCIYITKPCKSTVLIQFICGKAYLWKTPNYIIILTL